MGEHRLAAGEVLDRDRPVFAHLHEAVDQDERETVRNDIEHRADFLVVARRAVEFIEQLRHRGRRALRTHSEHETRFAGDADAVDHRAGNHGFGGVHRLHRDLDFGPVAGNLGIAELGLFQLPQVNVVVAGGVEFGTHRQFAELLHRFDLKHAGHDRLSGKVPLKKGLVHAEILDGNEFVLSNHLNPIEHQQRAALRENGLNRAQIQNFTDFKHDQISFLL
ncbi:hypothetical protein SDC9_137473 [bioreactor metagenome]|uniref:Uncharacterized protein n=1 Tax=bioreactor metagenome TaxID=1076179 RepID=A0A645DP82_9ZZZZ